MTAHDPAALDALFDGPGWIAEPGCAAVLTERGAPVWRRDFGLADLANARPIGSATRFRIASITKPLFALTMLALEDAGALALDDPLDRHVPETRLAVPPTLRQMLSMKSGVPETYELNWLAHGGGARQGQGFDADPALALLLRQTVPNFAPGARTLYSNGNYALLQLAAERASGQPLAAMLDAQVFAPAGMADSAVADGRATPHRNVAPGWKREHDRFIFEDPDVATGAAGSVIATVDDMARLWRWLASDPYRWRARMAAPVLLPGGTSSGYALGIARQTLAGRPVLGHAGQIGAWLCQTIWSPDDDVSVTVLGNRSDINWMERAREMLVRWWGAGPDPAATPRLVRADPPAPHWKGHFGNEAALVSWLIEGGPDEIGVEGRRVPATADGHFCRALGDELVTYELEGDPPDVIVRTEGNTRVRLERARPGEAPPAAALEGVYRAADLPEPLTVTNTPEGLRVSIGVRWPLEPPLGLKLVLGSLFRAWRGDEPHPLHICFETGADGRAAAATVALTRTLGVPFARTEEAIDRVWRFPEPPPPRFRAT